MTDLERKMIINNIVFAPGRNEDNERIIRASIKNLTKVEAISFISHLESDNWISYHYSKKKEELVLECLFEDGNTELLEDELRENFLDWVC